MTHPDARTLKPAAQAEKRRIAMTMREADTSFSEIGRALGVHDMTVSKWWDRYHDGGADALAAQKRGPAVGAHRRLSATQEQAVQRAITDTTPDQLQRPFALWTRAAVVQWIERKYGFTLPVRTMGHYLARWGFTAQKPITCQHQCEIAQNHQDELHTWEPSCEALRRPRTDATLVSSRGGGDWCTAGIPSCCYSTCWTRGSGSEPLPSS